MSALSLHLFAVRYPFINYRSSDGLPQSNVTAMLQDRDGYIWIGTQSGIGKFDGTRFEIFTTREGLAGNYITDLELDRDGGRLGRQPGRAEPHPCRAHPFMAAGR